MLDLDGISLPPGYSVIAEPEACVEWAVQHLLPPEFREASFVYQLSSSAGLTKADDHLNVHLWFFTDRPFWDEELRNWAHWWNTKEQGKIVDPSLYNPVQPHYTCDPELLEGLVDPLAGRRLGVVRRKRRTVPLYMPTEAELVEVGRLKIARARDAGRRLASRSKDRDCDDHADQPIEEFSNGDAPEADEDRGATINSDGAVCLGTGWRGYLAAIGFEGHIRTQMRAAIGSYLHGHGSWGDRGVIREAVEQAVEQSPFLDCGEPWSRSRQEAREYLTGPAGTLSNVDEMIRHFAARERAREQRADEVCEPAWQLPTCTADEASDEVKRVVLSRRC
jgi:hypothetical protein